MNLFLSNCKSARTTHFCFAIWLCFFSSFSGVAVAATQAAAPDDIILYRFKQGINGNEDYTQALLNKILEVTAPEYGSVSIKINHSPMVRGRLKVELLKGDMLNVVAVAPMDGWEDALRVPIPIRKGIGSFRLFMVRQEHVHLFKDVDTIELIKQVRTGAPNSWATTQILNHHDFNVIYGPNYESLFGMLSLGRFDTFMRGVNEIYDELQSYSKQFSNLSIEKNAAIFTYLPNYFYVSPKYPALAKRIEAGLREIIESGDFDKIFYSYYGDDIKAAKLDSLKIFFMSNNTLPDILYEQDKPFLLGLKLINK